MRNTATMIDPKAILTKAPVFASFAVKDIDLARKFYGSTLGLDVREDKEMGILEIHSPDKSHVLVYPKPDHQPAIFTVLNLQVRDIDEIVDALTSAGLRFERYNTSDIKTDAKGVARGDKQGAEHRLVPRPVGQHRVRDGGRSVLTSPQQAQKPRRRWSQTGGVSCHRVAPVLLSRRVATGRGPCRVCRPGASSRPRRFATSPTAMPASCGSMRRSSATPSTSRAGGGRRICRPSPEHRPASSTTSAMPCPGALHVVTDTGQELDVREQSLYEIPPGHDAWVVGDEPFVTIDWTSARTWGLAPERAGDGVIVTILFTDIVDSTATLLRIGDEAWRERLVIHNARLREHLNSYRGREVKTTGDGLLAVFDRPVRAAQCAEAMATTSRAMELPIRVGIHTGEVEFVGDDARGLAVHTAARIMSLGGADEVMVSSTTRELLEGSGISLEDAGEHELKGLPGVRRVFRLAR